jgi:hypothetical protein
LISLVGVGALLLAALTGVALAALAVALLLVVPLMAWMLMRRWPQAPAAARTEAALATTPSASPAPADTLFDLDLGWDESPHAPTSSIPPTKDAVLHDGVLQTAVRSAQQSHALGAQIGHHLASVVQARQRISDALAVIDAIACQTNALALQAAIDADADSACHGVRTESTEVRDLAQRAASAAQEIRQVVQATDAKMDPVARQVVGHIHADALVADAQTVLACLDELSEPSVARMDGVIERQNTWVHHSACLAQSLSDQADRLQKVVSAFKILQQTQEAAWLTHRAIHQARDMARDRAREGRKASRPTL